MSLIKQKLELKIETAEFETTQALRRLPTAVRWLLILSVIGSLPAYLLARNFSYNSNNRLLANRIISAKPSFETAADPQQGEITVATTGGGYYSAGLKITNPNIDLALAKTGFEMIFKDDQGEAYREKGQAFLLPNQSKFLVAPRFISQRPIKEAAFSWTEPLRWQKRMEIPAVDLQTSRVEAYNQFEPAAFVIEGNYYNNSPYQLDRVRLVFLIYDQNRKPIGFSQRDDFSLRPYERRGYKQVWPNIYWNPSGSVEVFAETDQLDRTNLDLPQTGSGESSSLERPENKAR